MNKPATPFYEIMLTQADAGWHWTLSVEMPDGTTKVVADDMGAVATPQQAADNAAREIQEPGRALRLHRLRKDLLDAGVPAETIGKTIEILQQQIAGSAAAR